MYNLTLRQAKPFTRSVMVYGCPFEMSNDELYELLEGKLVEDIIDIIEHWHKGHPNIKNGTRQVKYGTDLYTTLPSSIQFE